MQAVESFTPAMMAIVGNEAIYDAFLTTVSAHRVGNRPGRLEPRFKKRRPAWPVYMTIPRQQVAPPTGFASGWLKRVVDRQTTDCEFAML